MLDIRKANLEWNGKLKKLYVSKVRYIMIHHSAHPSWDVYDVHNYHKNSNGWIGIGYNFFINPDGTVFEGRGFNIGAGATGYNSNSIHICFAGNFEKQKPSNSQLRNGKELIKWLLEIVPLNVKIIGHKDIGKTACPGRNFPLEKFKNIRKEGKEMRYQKLEDVPNYAKATIEKLINKQVLQGNEKGLDLSDDMLRTFVILDRLGLFN